VAGPEKHFLDVDVVVVEHAARLVPARHHDGRNVDAGSRHQLPWHGLVTRGEADHAIEPRTFDLHLDVVGDQVAHRQNVVAAMAGAVDEVARRRGAHFERQPAGSADRFLHHLGNAVEMGKADRELGGGVDHRDLRLLHVGIGEAKRPPLRAPHGPERRATLEIAAKLSGH
jgi:hypothetical protein